MATDSHKEKKIIFLLIIVMIPCLALVVYTKGFATDRALTLCNASITLMPLSELSTEGGGKYGGCYTKAQKSHAEMIQKYVDHMNSRHVSLLLKLPPFSNNTIVKQLQIIAKDLNKASSSENEARDKINSHSQKIADFLSKMNIISKEKGFSFISEPMPEELRTAVMDALQEAHEKAGIFANKPNLQNSEDACMSNRRAIVYVYLACFGYRDCVDTEKLKVFRTDINRALYYNRYLQEYDPVILQGKNSPDSDYVKINKHSESELRRLWLLQLIIDYDFQQAQSLLKETIQKATGIQL